MTAGSAVSHTHKTYKLCKVHRIIKVQNITNTVQYYGASLHTNKLFTQSKECVFMYLHNATLNCAFSFLRFVTLHGKVLKILILE
jgi:hypothetical protein